MSDKMREAFKKHFGADLDDPDWHIEAEIWNDAWEAALAGDSKMSINYCCFGMYLDLDHSDDCPTKQEKQIVIEKFSQTEYDGLVNALFRKMEKPKDDMMHAAVGISGEAGELLDAIKKYWAYDKPLDVPNVLEELGDIYFYFTALRLKFGFSMLSIRQYNMEKLSKRYPSGVFKAEDAIARADKMDGE